MRRLLGGAVVLAMLLSAPAAQAASGPQLGFMRLDRQGVALETTDASGGTGTAIVSGAPGAVTPFLFSSFTWSGDGAALLFTGGVASSGQARGEFVAGTFGLYTVPGDGGDPTLVPHSATSLFPVGLPDGESVAVVKSRGQDSEEVSVEVGGKKGHNRHVRRTRSQSSLWILSLVGAAPRRLTPWSANVVRYPLSATPDGGDLVISEFRRGRKEEPPRPKSRAMLLDLATGGERPIGENVIDAVYSPDGTKRALVVLHPFPKPKVRKNNGVTFTAYGQTDVYVEDLATQSLHVLGQSSASEVEPSWDPSGERLSFVRLSAHPTSEIALLGLGDTVYEANADGTCLTRVLQAAQTGFVGPSWRPGAEHAAGRISC